MAYDDTAYRLSNPARLLCGQMHGCERGVAPYRSEDDPYGHRICGVDRHWGSRHLFMIGLLLFSEPATLARFFFVELIVIGIVGLKLASAQ
jgi:hypothetical protein